MTPNEFALIEENELLKATLLERDTELARRSEKIDELERQIEELCAKLGSAARDKRHLEKRLFELLNRRRALLVDPPGQLKLFMNESEPAVETPSEAKEAPDGETANDSIKRRHRTRSVEREISYQALRREKVFHELPLDQRVCPVTGLELVPIGTTITEELEYRPAELIVIEHHRTIYGLRAEENAERTVEPLVTPMPPRPIENALAGAGLIAWILVQKYRHHLPLYRQQAIFAREGLSIPRQSMCDWVMACAALLMPIQLALRRAILASGVVQTDDTPVLCQGSNGSGKFQAYIWTYTSPLVKGVVYDFTASREHEHVKAFLASFRGYLVGDGYAGYGTIARATPEIIEAGCWSHVLRKFRDALEEAPKDASEMMTLIAKLFEVEADASARNLNFEERLELRLEKSTVILDRIEARRAELVGRFSEQEEMSKALGYLKNQWSTLVRFLEDGRVPIHNNACENAIRPVAIGRRNWLFAGSERGGHAAATIYTLIESCRIVGVDPFVYLRDVLVRVATHPASRVEELLPARWKELFGSAGAERAN